MYILFDRAFAVARQKHNIVLSKFEFLVAVSFCSVFVQPLRSYGHYKPNTLASAYSYLNAHSVARDARVRRACEGRAYEPK